MSAENEKKVICKFFKDQTESRDCEKFASDWALEHGHELCIPCLEEARMAYEENKMWEERGGWD